MAKKRQQTKAETGLQNIIEFAQKAVSSFSKIETITDEVHVDFTKDNEENFGLSPTGDVLVKEDILGNQTRLHNFVLYAVYQSINDFDRITNSGALLELQYYLENLPKEQEIICLVQSDTAKAKKGKITEISCGNGIMYAIPNENSIDLVRYQLQIGITYQVINE